MRKLMSILFAAIILVGTSSFTLNSDKAETRSAVQKPKWEKLGTRTVKMTGDHDEIPVTILDGFFTKLKFKVMKAPIHVNNIKIVFGNGEHKNVKIDRRFAPGSVSKIIDLPGNKRVIKKIVLNYRTVPNHNMRAVVAVYGRH